ncbi:MAG: hypothetical protein HQK99_09880 [Nitrospirae bacterium]|nr:hypothetical protein [Nitrospirota bacterium]
MVDKYQAMGYNKDMSVIAVPKTLREKLGDDGVDDLIAVISEVGLNNDFIIKADINAIRQEMATKADINAIRQEMATKADIKAIRQEMATMATKEDLLKVESKLSERMTRIEGELTLVKWMMGIMLAGVISLVMKAFFMH